MFLVVTGINQLGRVELWKAGPGWKQDQPADSTVLPVSAVFSVLVPVLLPLAPLWHYVVQQSFEVRKANFAFLG
jgi:hypothetical protein